MFAVCRLVHRDLFVSVEPPPSWVPAVGKGVGETDIEISNIGQSSGTPIIAGTCHPQPTPSSIGAQGKDHGVVGILHIF